LARPFSFVWDLDAKLLAVSITRVDGERVRAMLAERVQLVEVLPRHEYEEQHLPGAISIPLKELDADAVGHLEREKAVIVYCWDSI
jgi:rhodanese-related sulfurtransferase